MIETAKEILKRYWGHSSFRASQETVIQHVNKGNNAVVLLPTGGGKSVCYQIPALMAEGICIVISPLIALMKDQVNSLNKKGIKAIALSSQLTTNEMIIAFDNLRYGNFKFLYLSPEKLQSKLVQEKIRQLNVSMVAIDEAHCISEWGHDFRPAYLKLNVLKELLSNSVFIALTATANKLVLDDIITYLPLSNPTVFQQSYQRKNIQYRVVESPTINNDLIKILNKKAGSIIIYTYSRKETKALSAFLYMNNFSSDYYHGGLNHKKKNETYLNWLSGKKRIIVATNAFGMGIDKADVRAVIHVNIPQSIENYVQESGRAGRDNKPALSLLLYNENLIKESQTRLTLYLPTTDTVSKVYDKLNQYYQIALGDLPDEKFNFSLQQFCNTYSLNYLRTFNALKVLEKEDIISLDHNLKSQSKIQILLSSKQLLTYLENEKPFSALITTILRSYGGVGDYLTVIDEFKLAKKIGVSRSKVVEQLTTLYSNGIIDYSKDDAETSLKFLVARENRSTMNRISANIKKQGNHKLKKHEEIISYIRNQKICRSRLLVSFFDEVITDDCGLCDICSTRNSVKDKPKEIAEKILDMLSESSLSSRQIVANLDTPKDLVLECIQILLEKNKIRLTSQQKFTKE